MITFESPRVGNEAFAKKVSEELFVLRIVQQDDPFPKVPPKKFGYRHIYPSLKFTKNESPPVYCVFQEDKKCSPGKVPNILAHSYYRKQYFDCDWSTGPKSLKDSINSGLKSVKSLAKKIPKIKKPVIKLPPIKKPVIKIPPIKIPKIKKPEIKLPPIKKPVIKIPPVKVPKIKKPVIKKKWFKFW